MALPVPFHLGGQRGHRGRRGLLGDRAQADRVNPGLQVVQRPVPPERNGPAAADHALDGGVIDEDLEPREPRKQLPEVLAAVDGVQVVLGPDVGKERPGQLPQVRPLLSGEDLHR